LATSTSVHSLDDLNQSLLAWIEVVYHRKVHSETGQSPLDRFRQDTAPSVHTVDPLTLRTAFLFRVTRRVTKTGHISFVSNRYSVPGFLAGQTIELRYDPFDLTNLEIWFPGPSARTGNGQFFTQAQPLHVQTSFQPGLSLDPAPPAPPPSTGLDYLAMLRQERERLLREQMPPIPFTRLNPAQEDEHVQPSV
jgi:putative transposase